MQIRSWLFISFWSVTSIAFLHLGFRALENTELSHSVSPAVMFLFKHSLAVSSCFASSYALKFRARPKPDVRSNFVLVFYVFVSFVFPRTIEGFLIWHLLKAIFACFLYLLLKLKIFIVMIFRFPAFVFLKLFWFLVKILPVIGVVMVALLLYNIPFSLILSTIYSVVGVIFSFLFIYGYQYIIAYAYSWIFSRMDFIWIPLFSFIGISSATIFAVYGLVLLYSSVPKLIMFCKKNFSELKTRAGILLAVEISLFFVTAKKRNFSPILVLSISHFISLSWASLSRLGDYALVSNDPVPWDGESVEGLSHIAVKFVILKMKVVLSRLEEHKFKKFIEFAVGTVGAILFQNFFRITSFGEVAAFLYFAVMWLANLVLLGFCGDFGVFNFLLANAVVGCTVGQFGLHSATWLALGAALLLFALRLKLESVPIFYEEAQRIELSFLDREIVAPPHHLPI